ncbi:MAG TPA: hypothetical protein VK437_17015 [Steroidobacteraceae bacterium]|nr:hypothetical protein [Steroidobacteraceae bacterium]
MTSDWMRVMLEEIERKKKEAELERIEQRRREEEAAPRPSRPGGHAEETGSKA